MSYHDYFHLFGAARYGSGVAALQLVSLLHRYLSNPFLVESKVRVLRSHL